MADFYQIAGFPRVIGAIDGCLIPIRGPDRDEHLYVCHKGFHAINVMAVCNAHLSFTNFVCRWHGSVHDSAVFNSCNLHVHMEGGRGRNGWLLGDRGYGIQPYLMTPLRPESVSTFFQSTYQKTHTKTRNTIRGPLVCARPDSVALIGLGEHCSTRQITAAQSLQQPLFYTICAFVTTQHCQAM